MIFLEHTSPGISLAPRLLLLTLLLTVGCDDPPTLGGDVVRQDSAGVSLVINNEQAWPTGRAWDVGRRPALEIGELDGAPEYTFDRIREVGFMPDGRIYVSDQGAHQVRLYDRGGEWVGSAGREGQGPGELGWIWSAGPYRGDSLWVYDYQNLAMSVYAPGPERAFARRVRMDYAPGANYWARGVFSDGAFLLYTPGRTIMPGPVGVREDSTLLLAMAPDGSEVDTLGVAPIIQKYVDADGRARVVEMSPALSVQVSGSQLYLAEGKEVEFEILSRDGELKKIVRRRWASPEVTEARKQQYIDTYIEHMERRGLQEGRLEDLRRRKEEAEHWSSVVPAVAALVIDETDHVWVGRPVGLGVAPNEWDIFDPSGLWLGMVETAETFDVKAISSDLIIGVYTDEYGVDYVRAYSLDRSL